jgi:hypothetical protein
MMKSFSKYAAVAATAAVAVVILAVPKASADSLSIVTTAPTGTDTVKWSQLGSPGASVPNPFAATSTGGIKVKGTFAGSGGGEILQQGSGWLGNFNPGDYVLWNVSNGPDTLSFNQGVSMAGAAIDPGYFDPFTAYIQAFDGTTALGYVTENGNGKGSPGSAIFLGLQDLTGANITSVQFWIPPEENFAIDTLYLNGSTNVPVIPEPSSIVLLGTGMLGLFGFVSMRRHLNCQRTAQSM